MWGNCHFILDPRFLWFWPILAHYSSVEVFSNIFIIFQRSVHVLKKNSAVSLTLLSLTLRCHLHCGVQHSGVKNVFCSMLKFFPQVYWGSFCYFLLHFYDLNMVKHLFLEAERDSVTRFLNLVCLVKKTLPRSHMNRLREIFHFRACRDRILKMT